MKCLLFYFILLVNPSSPAKILCAFLIPGYSHGLVFSSIVNELAKRGHEITLITLENVPIDKSNKIQHINFHNDFLKLKSAFPNVFATYPPREATMAENIAVLKGSHEFIFNSPEMQALLNPTSGTKNFDVILAEFPLLITLMLKELFHAPIIGISNMYIPEEIFHFWTGQLHHDKPAKTFAARMMTWSYHIMQYGIMKVGAYALDGEVQKYASYIKKSPEDIMTNMDLVFYVDIPGFVPARALPRFVIPMGPIHINDSTTLTKELKEYLDQSINGVVYISLGTNVKFDTLPQETIQKFVDTFERLPYNFILKCSKCDKIEREMLQTTSNVKIVKWVDQLSILGHANTKIFVSHAGYQSTLEAVYQAVPMITFPHVCDQRHNADQIVAKEIGLKLDIQNFQSLDLEKAILNLIENKKYKENMKERSIALRGQPMKGIDHISFWVDYLAKHKHVKFLHGESRYMPFMQYFNLDIILFHVLLTVITTSLIVKRFC